MTTLAAAGKQLQEALKKKSTLPLPKKAASTTTAAAKATQAKIDEVKKQIDLNKQSNADIFSEDDDFIDRHCEEEKYGPLANLSLSGFSDDEEEEEEEEESDNDRSITLESESEEEEEKSKKARHLVKMAGKMPRYLYEKTEETKKRKRETEEEDEKLRRLEQLSTTINNNIKEYERLRNTVNKSLTEVEEAIKQLEAKEKSCETATLFVLDQNKVKEHDEAVRKREVELEAKEKAFQVKQDEVVKQFTLETERRTKELADKTEELEKREKALQQQKNVITTPTAASILEGFKLEMHKTNQNTLNREIYSNILSPLLMSNIATLSLKATNGAALFKTYSTSNGKYILLDIENAEGSTLLSQVISKELYNVK